MQPSIFTWKIPWTESLVVYSPRGHKESDTTEHTCTRRKNVSSEILEWEMGIDMYALVILCMK